MNPLDSLLENILLERDLTAELSSLTAQELVDQLLGIANLRDQFWIKTGNGLDGLGNTRIKIICRLLGNRS